MRFLRRKWKEIYLEFENISWFSVLLSTCVLTLFCMACYFYVLMLSSFRLLDFAFFHLSFVLSGQPEFLSFCCRLLMVISCILSTMQVNKTSGEEPNFYWAKTITVWHQLNLNFLLRWRRKEEIVMKLIGLFGCWVEMNKTNLMMVHVFEYEVWTSRKCWAAPKRQFP